MNNNNYADDIDDADDADDNWEDMENEDNEDDEYYNEQNIVNNEIVNNE